MTGKRLRLNVHERAYILRLIAEDNKMHHELISRVVVRLVKKLEDDEALTTNQKKEKPL